MNSFNSMKNKLESTGLYRVEDGSNIKAELTAYAAGLDELFSQLDEILDECYVPTASGYGITQRELFIGVPRDEYTLDKRREMLINREQTIGLACTVDAYKKILKSYGLSDFTLTEDFSNQEVTISINDSLTDEIKTWINKRAQEDFPTHLTVTVTYAQ